MSDLDNEELEATKMLNLIDEIKECAKNTTREDIIEVVERLGIEKEKTADEMFEELGYEKIHDMRYYNFNLHKDIYFADLYIEIAYGELSMQELQAINKKCKELRMDIIEYYNFWLQIHLGILPLYIFLIIYFGMFEIAKFLINSEKELKGYKITKKLDDFEKRGGHNE